MKLVLRRVKDSNCWVIRVAGRCCKRYKDFESGRMQSSGQEFCALANNEGTAALFKEVVLHKT